MKMYNADYLEGRDDASFDVAGDWVDFGLEVDGIVNQLRVMAGASDEYIRGYIDALVDMGLVEKPLENQ